MNDSQEKDPPSSEGDGEDGKDAVTPSPRDPELRIPPGQTESTWGTETREMMDRPRGTQDG